jgi:hypothetical protein
VSPWRRKAWYCPSAPDKSWHSWLLGDVAWCAGSSVTSTGFVHCHLHTRSQHDQRIATLHGLCCGPQHTYLIIDTHSRLRDSFWAAVTTVVCRKQRHQHRFRALPPTHPLTARPAYCHAARSMLWSTAHIFKYRHTFTFPRLVLGGRDHRAVQEAASPTQVSCTASSTPAHSTTSVLPRCTVYAVVHSTHI